MTEPDDISNPDRFIMGDLLRLAFFAARRHPDVDVRTAILSACDEALDIGGAPPLSEKEIQRTLASVTGPTIAPMIATDLDIAVTTRVWRACAAVGKSLLFVGSADAIGEGYGVLLGNGPQATYRGRLCGRSIGTNKDLASINLGLLPTPQSIGLLRSDLIVNLKVDPKVGIAVVVEGVKTARGALSGDLHSWISGRVGDRKNLQKPNSIHALGLSVDVRKDGSIAITPKSPEATIRFASACASRSLLCLNFEDDLYAPSNPCLIILAPSDTAPCNLAAEIHSRSGPLSDWLRIPPLRLVPELTREVRDAIAHWLHESKRSPIGDTA